MQAAVQQAHAADRFAREIAAILALSDAARSRRLMRKTLGAEERNSYDKGW